MRCQCCKKEAVLSARVSELFNRARVLLCDRCLGHEPRHLIVLASHAKLPFEAYVSARNYCGTEIKASEVI